jgi:hypothetical protein
MKIAFIAATFIAALAVSEAANAFPRVVTNPGYCAQFYPNANCQDYGPGNPYTGSYQAAQGTAHAAVLNTMPQHRALHSRKHVHHN